MTAIIVGGSLYGSLDSLKAVMDTAYPGKRVSLGGDMPKRDILLFLTNWKMPFQDVPYSIIRKSVVLSIIFVILPLSPFIFIKNQRKHLRFCLIRVLFI